MLFTLARTAIHSTRVDCYRHGCLAREAVPNPLLVLDDQASLNCLFSFECSVNQTQVTTLVDRFHAYPASNSNLQASNNTMTSNTATTSTTNIHAYICTLFKLRIHARRHQGPFHAQASSPSVKNFAGFCASGVITRDHPLAKFSVVPVISETLRSQAALLQWAGSEIHVGPTVCFGGGCSRILVGCVFWSEHKIATIYRHRRVDWVCKALLARWISYRVSQWRPELGARPPRTFDAICLYSLITKPFSNIAYNSLHSQSLFILLSSVLIYPIPSRVYSEASRNKSHPANPSIPPS